MEGEFFIINIPQHINHQSLISIISDIGVEIVTALQLSRLSFEMNQSNFKSNDYSEFYDWGTGFYLLHGEQDAFYSINEYSQSTSPVVDISSKLVKKQRWPDSKNSNSETPSNQITIDISNEGPWTHDYKSEVNNLIKDISSLFQDYPNIKYWINLQGEIAQKTFQSSFTAPIIQNYSLGLLTVELYHHNSGDPCILVNNFGGIMNEDFNFSNIENKLQNSLEIVNNLQSADYVSPGKYPIMLSTDTSYSLIHESIGHGTEADQHINGNSFLSGRIGTKVASTNLTIIDDPHVRGAGWAEYDDEGTKTKGTMLVEDGILIDLLHTRKSSRILNENPTGNARTSSYITPPEPRQSNIMIEPKDISFEEQLEIIKDGIYLGPTHTASTSIYSGQIMIETQYGYLIKNGSIDKLLKPVTLSGNSLDILNRVNSVGDQVEKFPTQCLKQSNKIMIGAYSPSLTLSEFSL